MSTAAITRAAKRDRINAQHEALGRVAEAKRDALGRAERWLESERGQASLMGALVAIAVVSGFLPK